MPLGRPQHPPRRRRWTSLPPFPSRRLPPLSFPPRPRPPLRLRTPTRTHRRLGPHRRLRRLRRSWSTHRPGRVAFSAARSSFRCALLRCLFHAAIAWTPSSTRTVTRESCRMRRRRRSLARFRPGASRRKAIEQPALLSPAPPPKSASFAPIAVAPFTERLWVQAKIRSLRAVDQRRASLLRQLRARTSHWRISPAGRRRKAG